MTAPSSEPGRPWAIAAASGLAACLVLGAGCAASRRSIDAVALGPADRVMVYRGGVPVVDRPVAADSEEGRAVAAWLAAHESGWRPDFASYAPDRRVSGPGFTVDFRRDRCVLNAKVANSDRWAQVSRPIAAGEPIPEVFGTPGPSGR